MTALQQRMLKRLGDVTPGATMCPGKLSRDCGTTQKAAREEILELVRKKKIALSQRGRPASPETLKGPFRVRLH